MGERLRTGRKPFLRRRLEKVLSRTESFGRAVLLERWRAMAVRRGWGRLSSLLECTLNI